MHEKETLRVNQKTLAPPPAALKHHHHHKKTDRTEADEKTEVEQINDEEITTKIEQNHHQTGQNRSKSNHIEQKQSKNGSKTTINLAGITEPPQKPPQTRCRRLEQTVVRRAAPLIAPPSTMTLVSSMLYP
jgi:D-alanyl-D-alanine carboxypeptidase